jgi:hypothetical protein
MAQAVRRQPVTAEDLVRSQVSPCGICSGQSGTGTGFPLSISFHRCSITRKNEKETNHLLHSVPQEASRLRCVCRAEKMMSL